MRADDATPLKVLLASVGTERWAQEKLYRDWVDWVGQVARSAGVTSSELEDVVHDAFMTAFTSISALESPTALRAWLARLTVRQVARRRRWRTWLTLFTGPQDETRAWEELLDPTTSVEVMADVRRVSVVLARQKHDARMIWVLHRWQGLSLEETSVAVGLSLATVKRRLSLVDAAVSKLKGEVER